MVNSCDKSELGPVANTTNPGSPSITTPESGQSYTLTEENANDTLITIEWSKPDYGFKSAPSFKIHMDSTGHNFEDPVQIANTSRTSFSLTVGEMNSTLLGAGYPFGEPLSLDFRVIATLSDSVGQQVSDPITLEIQAYSVCQYCPTIYVPGGYQSASGYGSNWTPGDAPALTTVSGQDVYEGYVYMASFRRNQFKFTS
ncbi:SusE domain-containing protein [Fodinibius sp.]|uniref:SusE domain-containing protein n=1 Tax=Fodinibius sp. TaxID=1872440 RepID=UPI002ACE6A9F|nr:SusE domain-containing protein [Fodinibius sp.]MDZ7660091.1 SusE domain-containing protein [Fodinibius sp.]